MRLVRVKPRMLGIGWLFNMKDKDKKVVCIKSGNRCAMPDCRKELVIDATEHDEPSIIGELAHIKGEKPDSARYDSNMSDDEKNGYKNRMLVCRDCHKKIDDQEKTYTEEKLNQIKQDHERWIIESTKNEIVNITFAELNIVTKYLVLAQYAQSDNFTVVPPKDKIKKNNISSSVEALITMGTIQANQVSAYISKAPDIDFGERLKQGFVEEYERLKNKEGLEGDELFMALLDFASGGSNDFRQKAAGLAVLVYLFEKCEVFEK